MRLFAQTRIHEQLILVYKRENFNEGFNNTNNNGGVFSEQCFPIHCCSTLFLQQLMFAFFVPLLIKTASMRP